MTSAWAAAVCGAALVGGVFLLVTGFQKTEPRESTPLSTGLWTRLRTTWTTASRTLRIWVCGVLVVSVLAFALTGWVLMLIDLPALALGVPYLLSAPRNRDVELLEALDRWVRLLASALPTGRSIPDAVRSTLPMAPARLAGPLRLAVARLDDRWTFREALLAMADELAAPDADAVVAALVLAAQRGGTGATASMLALSDAVQDRLRALREVETERAKPRMVVRQVTAITLIVLGAGIVLSPLYFAPYSSDLGQLLGIGYAGAFLGCLYVLRRRTLPRRRERFLAGWDAAGVTRGAPAEVRHG